VVGRRTITHPVVLVVSDDEAGARLAAAPLDELASILDTWTLRLEGDARERRLVRVTVRGAAAGSRPAMSEEGQ
jgi:hypothetical protein